MLMTKRAAGITAIDQPTAVIEEEFDAFPSDDADHRFIAGIETGLK
jgi:hypothetical protein